MLVQDTKKLQEKYVIHGDTFFRVVETLVIQGYDAIYVRVLRTGYESPLGNLRRIPKARTHSRMITSAPLD